MKECIKCGCTDDNCTACVEKTGQPCMWLGDKCSACYGNETRTSEEWDKLSDFNVLDPDGWDRKNFEYSWSEGPITAIEFTKRILYSTTFFKHESPSDYPGTDFLGLPAEH